MPVVWCKTAADTLFGLEIFLAKEIPLVGDGGFFHLHFAVRPADIEYRSIVGLIHQPDEFGRRHAQVDHSDRLHLLIAVAKCLHEHLAHHGIVFPFFGIGGLEYDESEFHRSAPAVFPAKEESRFARQEHRCGQKLVAAKWTVADFCPRRRCVWCVILVSCHCIK